MKTFPISDSLRKITNVISDGGGHPFVVGGAVRDFVLNLPAKDIDIEYYNLEVETLQGILQKHFKVDAVGKSFGVMKVQADEEIFGSI